MSEAVIDMRSDVKTLPSEGMIQAMGRAEVGDDKAGEDPTVCRLETLAAKRLGVEAAMLVVSGTMGNLVSLMAHAEPGDGMVLDATSHLWAHESAGFRVTGLKPWLLRSEDGQPRPADVVRAIQRATAQADAAPRVLHLENTHVLSGGRVMPIDRHQELCEIARAHEMAVHLDGARLFNAEVATGTPASAFAATVDSVTFCLSKGLSCPIGALVCGSRAVIQRARAARGMLGGGMRQAGVIAAAGVVALETMIDRLADDHTNARRLAEHIHHMPGLRLARSDVESNMLKVGLVPPWTTAALRQRFEAAGVRVGEYRDGYLRLVVHRHHDRTTIDEAAQRRYRALAGPIGG